MNKIFISHRTTDKKVADMLLDFLVTTGIPRDAIKCSSLPGNDVKVRIEPEIKQWIQESVVNIAILSRDYYKSAYCLNEAGVLWYLNGTTVITIGLPEINHEDMVGFLNDDYKLRRLDSDDDIAFIYDEIREAMGVQTAKHAVVNAEIKKLKERYEQFCAERESSESVDDEDDPYLEEEDTMIDGYHEVHNRDGSFREKGTYKNGKLIEGIYYNEIIAVYKEREEPLPTPEDAENYTAFEMEGLELRLRGEPVKPEDIHKQDWCYNKYGIYDGFFEYQFYNKSIKTAGLEYFYVVDRKVKLEGKIIKPTLTNFRTLESVLAEKEPDVLERIKTGVEEYEEADTAEVEV